jgi:hypothetical protein
LVKAAVALLCALAMMHAKRGGDLRPGHSEFARLVDSRALALIQAGALGGDGAEFP